MSLISPGPHSLRSVRDDLYKLHHRHKNQSHELFNINKHSKISKTRQDNKRVLKIKEVDINNTINKIVFDKKPQIQIQNPNQKIKKKICIFWMKFLDIFGSCIF